MAKIKADTPQTGVSTETTGAGGDAASAISASGTSESLPDSNQANVSSETEELAEKSETADFENVPVTIQQSQAGEGGSGAKALENSSSEQTASAPVASENDDDTPPAERVLNQHAEAETARLSSIESTGGEETVATGIHKGRKIVDGNIDFSTPSDREQRAAARRAAEELPDNPANSETEGKAE